MKSAVALLVVAACIPPDDTEAVTASSNGPLALYRVENGDCLSGIAHKLGFHGGWKALAAANGLRGDQIRAGSGLVIPLDRLAPGVDPYRDLNLLPYEPPIPAQRLVACASEHAEGPCATVAGVTACVEATDRGDEPDEPGRELAIYRGDERRALPLPGRGPLWLDAHAADLDGDRRPELVIAVPLDRRNRLSFEQTRVFVVDGELVTRLDVEQWGPGSLLAAGDRCELLATAWDDFTPPLEGVGMYFIGRPVAYAHGALVPRGDIVVRRMRTHFHVSVLFESDFERPLLPAAPAEWLSTDASWWHEPPRDVGYRVTLHGDYARGTIVDVEPRKGGVALVVALDRGERVVLDPDDGDIKPHDAPWPLDSIVWAPTGGLLPPGYVPAEPARWIGARVVIDRYSNDEGECDVLSCPYVGYVARLSPR
jgi:hypothetical protein